MRYVYGIVIVTYNRLELLKECVEQVLMQTEPAEKIIIVNNASTDGTKEYLEENFRDVNKFLICHENENQGGAGGFNQGIQLAMKEKLDWIMLIDDDAMLEKSCMENMNPFNFKEKTMAYATTVYCKGEVDNSHRCGTEKNVNIVAGKEFICKYATFCGLMLHRELIDKIGYPLKEYFIWYDDTEYCMRIDKECNIAVSPKAVLNHKILMKKENSSVSWKNYYGIRNSIHACIYHKNYKSVFKQILHATKKIMKYTIKGLFNEEYRGYRKLYIAALSDGVQGKLGKNKDYLPESKI